MREGFSLSATVEALQLLIPCPIYGELVKGDDCPSWRGSLLEFKFWLNKSTILKHSKKSRNHDKTAHGTIPCFFLWPLKTHLPSKFYHSNVTAWDPA